jgi:GNAT superfamily N-acetyltransferase
LRIRRAQDYDKSKILEFCKDTFAWGDYIESVFDIWLTNPCGILLVVDYPDLVSMNYEPVAISHISICPNGLLWIEGIRVDKGFRNKGIATHLLQYAENYGIEKGMCESFALVSHHNSISKKMFEKQGFSENCAYDYYNLKIKKQMENTNSSIKLKYASLEDVHRISRYLSNSKTYLEQNSRYFREWRFYRLENSFECINNLIDKKKLVLIVDEAERIFGLSIINITGNDDPFYNKPILQICYLDCVDNCIFSNSVFLILNSLYDHKAHSHVQLFVNESFDFPNPFDDTDGYYDVHNIERFIVYGKRLKQNGIT